MADREPRTVVKEVANAKRFSDGTILLLNVRASYPNVLRRYKGDDDGEGKFSIVGLMPKKKAYRPARDLINERIEELMKEAKVKNLKADNKFFRDGDQAGRDEYEGMWTVNASEQRPPRVRDNKADPKTGKPKVLKAGEDEDRIYPGCWVNVLIRPWFMNNKFGKKVNAALVAVQFVKDDEPFGQGRISDDEIDGDLADYVEDADDDDDDDDSL
jgi:hypothetical protein